MDQKQKEFLDRWMAQIPKTMQLRGKVISYKKLPDDEVTEDERFQIVVESTDKLRLMTISVNEMTTEFPGYITTVHLNAKDDDLVAVWRESDDGKIHGKVTLNDRKPHIGNFPTLFGPK